MREGQQSARLQKVPDLVDQELRPPQRRLEARAGLREVAVALAQETRDSDQTLLVLGLLRGAHELSVLVEEVQDCGLRRRTFYNEKATRDSALNQQVSLARAVESHEQRLVSLQSLRLEVNRLQLFV